jgi:hypothetical protein
MKERVVDRYFESVGYAFGEQRDQIVQIAERLNPKPSSAPAAEH